MSAPPITVLPAENINNEMKTDADPEIDTGINSSDRSEPVTIVPKTSIVVDANAKSVVDTNSQEVGNQAVKSDVEDNGNVTTILESEEDETTTTTSSFENEIEDLFDTQRATTYYKSILLSPKDRTQTTLSSGEAQTAPPPGGAQTAPPPGGEQTDPHPGGAQTAPPPGGTQTAPPPGVAQTDPSQVGAQMDVLAPLKTDDTATSTPSSTSSTAEASAVVASTKRVRTTIVYEIARYIYHTSTPPGIYTFKSTRYLLSYPVP